MTTCPSNTSAVHGTALDVAGHADTGSRDRMHLLPTPAAQVAPPPPMVYMIPDREPPPWNPEQDLYRRWRRRVRCAADGAEG